MVSCLVLHSEGMHTNFAPNRIHLLAQEARSHAWSYILRVCAPILLLTASISWLKKHDLMPGLTFSNKLVSHNEGLQWPRRASLSSGGLVGLQWPRRASSSSGGLVGLQQPRRASSSSGGLVGLQQLRRASSSSGGLVVLNFMQYKTKSSAQNTPQSDHHISIQHYNIPSRTYKNNNLIATRYVN
ncbi:hypothetical protein BD769DRAFT_1395573 [Suillus cothurnatus]|nr:hypothetical protein BD769DRAFT_1395573 [Suillus cothurnatus]